MFSVFSQTSQDLSIGGTEEDSSMLTLGSQEYERSPPQPDNWRQQIAKIARNPNSHRSIFVTGVSPLNGIYICNGILNERPYYMKCDGDTAIGYYANQRIWAITDKSSINDIDPELYAFADCSAWDVTSISDMKYWCLADSEGNWNEDRNMKVICLETSSCSSKCDTTFNFEQWSLSKFSSFWEEINEVKTWVEQNTKKMEILTGEVNKIYNVSKTCGNHEKRIVKLENLAFNFHVKRRRSAKAPPGWTLDDFISQGKIEEATKVLMTDWLKAKRKQGVRLAGKLITVSGRKATLIERVKAILEQEMIS